MTDGIIQKTFTKYIQLHDSKSPDNYTNVLEDHYRGELIELQQELISEIKKEFPITEVFRHVHNNGYIQQKLIGDNEK